MNERIASPEARKTQLMISRVRNGNRLVRRPDMTPVRARTRLSGARAIPAVNAL